ncbi:MAG: aldose epimerase family protein [Proteocatella sp.]
MKITKSLFGFDNNKNEVLLYTIESDKLKASFCNYGAILTSLILKLGSEERDIVLGFDNLMDYINDDSSFGAICGRFANRIKSGKFELNNEKYSLAINNGGNHLHGGFEGFNKKYWEATLLDDGIRFEYFSKDMEEGYPGNLNVCVTYKILNSALEINYHATSDKDTIVNLTNHTYFNLSGHDSGNILSHIIKINASSITELDKSSCPNGNIIPVENTPFDFRSLTRIDSQIIKPNPQLAIGNGYDHNYIIDPALCKESFLGTPLIAEAKLSNQDSLKLKLYSTKPGLQFYTGNYIKKGLSGKNGCTYAPNQGFCFETQHFPDSINHQNFPSPILKANEVYSFKSIFKFEF